MKWHEQVPRHERLVDALADDILAAADDDILASHSTGEARVVAGALRQALQRAVVRVVAPADGEREAPRSARVQPDRSDDEERR